jgi:hypothetical protein
MKYKIFKLDKPDILEKIERDGWDISTSNGIVLKEIDIYDLKDKYDSIEIAEQDILRHKNKLQGIDLIILPMISISYSGEIKDF